MTTTSVCQVCGETVCADWAECLVWEWSQPLPPAPERGPEYVYLLHFAKPIGGTLRRDQAQHYIGWARDAEHLQARIHAHTHGHNDAAALTKYVADRGIDISLARTWEAAPGTGRGTERRIKNRGGATRFCPTCKGGN